MEFAAYISIIVGGVSILVGIPIIIYGIYDNKRRERQEQEESPPSAVPQ